MQNKTSVAGLLAIGLASVALLSACSAVTTTPAPGGSASANTATPTPEVSSSTEPAASPPAGAITVELAGPPPHFVPADLKAPAADLVFFLHNRSPGIHTLAIGRELRYRLSWKIASWTDPSVKVSVSFRHPSAC